MKKNMLSTLLLCALAGSIISCRKNAGEPIVKPIEDNSLPSGAVLSIKLLGKSAASLEYALDVAVFRDSKNLENHLSAVHFMMDTLSQSTVKYYFGHAGISLVNGGTARPYSALMLMDQSGSISTTDPLDYRLEAAAAFCRNLGKDNHVMLWSFAEATATAYGTGFTSDGNQLLPFIENLRGKQGGATPLYSSQLNVTNYCASNAVSEGKAVMTFTDGANTASGTASDQVIGNAIAKKVQLFNVGLGSAQIVELSRQSAATGGAFMFAKDARQLISMFGNLGKLLNKTGQFYHTVWKVTRSNGNFGAGTISHNLRIVLPYGGEVLIPFSLDY